MSKRVRLSPRDERRITRAWRAYRRNIWTPTPEDEADLRAEMALDLDVMSAEVTA